MSTDNRTVATDALATLGTIIGVEAKRDAIHLAVEPVTADERLQPGQRVTYDKWTQRASPDDGRGNKGRRAVGIVDPFLKTPVEANERFWLVLYPGQIQNLRHTWVNDAFQDETSLDDYDDDCRGC